jgi:hypothetical protein
MIGAPPREDFWRLRPATASSRGKEWHHFVVFAPGCELIINFSMIGDQTHVILLARTDRWHGIVESVTARESMVTPDGCESRIAGHRLVIDNAGYRLTIATADHRITGTLELRLQTIPMAARSRAMGRGQLQWTLCARLAVAGRITIDGTTFPLDGSLAYHDHNWGELLWGDDAVWEWGAMLPTDPIDDWAVVYSRLLDRARGRVTSQHVMVWRGALNVLAAGSTDVNVRAHGVARLRPEARIPLAMALVQPRLDAEVPRRVQITVDRGEDSIALAFLPRSLAQILIPAETSLSGVVTINECTGPCRIAGTLDGESFEWEGRGVFEFVRG